MGKHRRMVLRTVRHHGNADLLGRLMRELCDLCGRSTTDLEIDHDHACCSGRFSECGLCVRGVLCGRCNTNLAHYEAITLALSEVDLVGYLTGNGS